MPNARLIKRRIKSAQNIAKITKALEMVSASKMRRAQSQAQASQPYSRKLQNILQTIAHFTDSSLHPLLQHHPEGKTLLLLISTSRGLCGPLNTNLFKSSVEFTDQHAEFTVITVGQKAYEYARRMGWDITASFLDIPERVSFADVLPISTMLREGFLGVEFSEVHIGYMEFVNTLTQRARIFQLLPFQTQAFDSAQTKEEDELLLHSDYLFEPNPGTILDWLLPYYLEVELYQLMLEARASEHSARMIAMQNASNNAADVVSSLTLEYNKSRQASITQELIEMTSAKEHA